MKKIKIFPAPHVELRIHVSDEMIRDMHECRRKLAETGNGGDCSKCTWDKVDVFDTGMCEFDEVVNKVMEMEERRTDRSAPVCMICTGES